MDVCQGSRVQLVKAELEMLQLIEEAHDVMTAIVQNCMVLEIFAGCVRSRKLRSKPRVFSENNREDKRLVECMKIVASVQQLINSALGFEEPNGSTRSLTE